MPFSVHRTSKAATVKYVLAQSTAEKQTCSAIKPAKHTSSRLSKLRERKQQQSRSISGHQKQWHIEPALSNHSGCQQRLQVPHFCQKLPLLEWEPILEVIRPLLPLKLPKFRLQSPSLAHPILSESNQCMYYCLDFVLSL